MKKFLLNSLFYFILPLMLIFAISEYSLRSLPNDYAYKSNWMNKNCQNIETLCIGPSIILYDINPEYLSTKAFNAAHLLESVNYDYFIFNNYIDKMDSLKHLIIGIDYWTLFCELEESPEWWRAQDYFIYYDCNYHKNQFKYRYKFHHPTVETLKNAQNAFLTLLGKREDSHLTVNELGYSTKYAFNNRKANWDNGIEEAALHNSFINTNIDKAHIIESGIYIYDIISKCESKNIQVLLINTPVYDSYITNTNPKYVEVKNEFCRYFDEHFSNTRYFDFTNDSRFTGDDFYDSNHLNDEGAKKFTLIVDSIIQTNIKI